MRHKEEEIGGLSCGHTVSQGRGGRAESNSGLILISPLNLPGQMNMSDSQIM